MNRDIDRDIETMQESVFFEVNSVGVNNSARDCAMIERQKPLILIKPKKELWERTLEFSQERNKK